MQRHTAPRCARLPLCRPCESISQPVSLTWLLARSIRLTCESIHEIVSPGRDNFLSVLERAYCTLTALYLSIVPDLPPRSPTGVTSTCPSCPGLAKPRRAWRGPAARRLLGGAARSVSPSPPRPSADPPLHRGDRPGGHSGITYIYDQHTIALPGADPATIEQGPNGEVYIYPRAGSRSGPRRTRL